MNKEEKAEVQPNEVQENSEQETVSLASEVEESKRRLAESALAPPRNRGGRPKGSRDKSPRNKAGNDGRTPDVSAPQSLAQQPAPGPGPLMPVLRHAVRAPYEFAAGRTGFQGFKLSEEEAEELAKLTDQVLAFYFPNLGDKASLLLVWTGSVAIVTMGKIQAYRAALEAAQAAELRRQAAENLARPPQPTESEGAIPGVFPTLSQ